MAAGGGGDAITSAALSRALNLTDPLVIMTYSWDRLMIDPLPGPRSAADFTGLRYLGPHTAEILPDTQARPPAGSSLPRLADAAASSARSPRPVSRCRRHGHADCQPPRSCSKPTP